MAGIRIWVKRAALLIAAMLVGLALLVSVLLAVSEEADYRRLLVWSADYFLESELLISGPLTAAYPEGVLLAAQAFRMNAHDGSYSLEATDFRLHFHLMSVFSGALWIDELALGELKLKINEPEHGAVRAGFDLPTMVVARARVNALLVEYQEATPGTLHRFTLENLRIDDAGTGGPQEVKASGTFKDEAFVLDGILPSLDSMQDRVVPKPIRLGFVSEKINIVLEGSIKDPLKGKGLDLDVDVSVAAIDEFFEIFADDIPTLGRLEMSAVLRGDYSVPRLEEIDLRLQRGERLDLEIKGMINNVRTRDDARLRIKGQSDNPAVLSRLLFRQHDRLSAVSLSAGLEIKHSRYFVADLDLTARTPEGLNIQFTGAGEIFSAGHRFRKRDAGFSVNVHAPKTSVFRMANRRLFPDLGPVSGTAMLAAGFSAVALFDTDISIGSRSGTHLSLRGDLENIPLTEAQQSQERSLELKITTADLARLGKQFQKDWPDLGQGELTGTVKMHDKVLRLDNARLKVGRPGRPAITATGNMTSELNRGTSIDLAFDAVAAELLTAQAGGRREDLGHLRGTIRLSDLDGDWGFEKLRLTSADTDLYRLNILGNIDDLARLDRGSLEVGIAVADMVALGMATGMKLSGIAPVETKGRLRFVNGTFHYNGSASLGQTAGTTELEGSVAAGRPHLRGSLAIPLLYPVDLGIGGSRGRSAGQRTAGAGNASQVFSRDPLNTSFLNSFDLELDLSIDEVTGEVVRIDSVDGHISVRAGRLRVTPLHLNFEGGRANVEFEIHEGALPEYKLGIDAEDIRLGSLLAQVENDIPIRGSSSLHAQLAARGRSLHQLASSLDGAISLGVENARIPKQYVTFLSADLLGWVGSKSLFQDKFADLHCVLISLDSTDGMIASKTLIADGPTLSLGGRINMDLEKETLDVVFLPKQKQRVFASISPVKITGPMKNPEVVAIPARAAIQEIGTLVLLPGVAVSLKVFEKVWSLLDAGDAPGEGCEKLEKLSGGEL